MATSRPLHLLVRLTTNHLDYAVSYAGPVQPHGNDGEPLFQPDAR
jgi:hypothetical protein